MINNARQFFDERVASSGDSSYYVDKKDMNYEANTKVGTEDIRISLSIHSVDKNIEEDIPEYCIICGGLYPDCKLGYTLYED